MPTGLSGSPSPCWSRHMRLASAERRFVIEAAKAMSPASYAPWYFDARWALTVSWLTSTWSSAEMRRSSVAVDIVATMYSMAAGVNSFHASKAASWPNVGGDARCRTREDLGRRTRRRAPRPVVRAPARAAARARAAPDRGQRRRRLDARRQRRRDRLG